ncbi:MAG TPA: 50S ribosomal protein L15 [Candidatus Omnitrophota bacterium]|nr:50S ribosomal protein L15 [Candidatus Omnitrophota bacterium]HPS36172.1 50S ribosomal protein L15 [Candidatus Omnitrophota bacterium]
MRAKFPYKKKRKRIGCGIGSGHGKTSTKGHKGQRARSGKQVRQGFEGGQNPLYRRLPKRGFNHDAFRKFYCIINLQQLALLSEKEITPELLVKKGVVKELLSGLKVLGNGEVKKALTVKAHLFSASAKTKIEAAGGQAVVIPFKG